jgi:hypothetical protein
MHKLLCTDQVSLEALLNTERKKNIIMSFGRKGLQEHNNQIEMHAIITPVALWVKVSLFSTPNTFIL